MLNLYLNTFKNSIYRFSAMIVLILLISIPFKAKATHAMAVDLTYKCLGGNLYEFTLTFYRDCRGIAAPVSPTLHISSNTCNAHDHINLAQSGPGLEVSAICNAILPNTSCNGGSLPGVQKYTYKGTYTLPSNCTDWVFSYSECCRNNLITNLVSKNDIYIEATLNNSIASCNSSPTFTSLPVPYICSGQPYTYTHGVVDENGDSLVYNLINPLEDAGDPIGFRPGYSVTNPILNSSTFVFDNATGEMKVTPNANQVCVLAMQVSEYRNGILIGTTMRDMQVIVSTCTNTIPYITNSGAIQNQTGGILTSPNVIEVCPGESVNFDIDAIDDDGQTITLTSNVAASIPGATFVTSCSGSNQSAHFTWNTTSADAGFHTFTVTVQDDACQVSGQQTYSFSINILQRTTAGPDRFYCTAGGPLQLKATGGSAFTWTMLDGSPPIGLSCNNCSDPLASPSVNSTYIVSSNFSTNCQSKDTITISIVPNFTISVADDTVQLCIVEEGSTIQVNAGPDPISSYTYEWSPSSTLSDKNIFDPTAKPTSTTTYYAKVTSTLGCTITDSVVVRVNSLVDLYIIPHDSVEICDTAKLDVVLVPKGEIFSEPFDHEIDATNWTSISGGILSDQCGTIHEDSYYFNQPGTRSMITKTLDVHRGGAISFYIKAGSCDQCICDKPENDEEDENFYLDYSIDGGTTWESIQVYNADYYNTIVGFSYITVEIPEDAKTTSTQFRWRQLNHASDKDVWIFDEIKIKEGLSQYTYQWTPGNTLSNDTIKNPLAFPRETTTYVLVVTDKETGCTFTDSVKVKFKKEFGLSLLPTIRRCPDDTSFVELKAETNPNPGQVLTYKWDPPTDLSDPSISNPKASPDSTTTYTVVVTDPATGCYRREQIIVEVTPFKVSTISDTSVCASHKAQLDVAVDPPGDYDYLWRPITGISNQTIQNPTVKPSKETLYTVFVRHNPTACIKFDTVRIKVFPDFTLSTTGSTTLCPAETGVDISAKGSPGTNFTYLWDTDPDIIDRNDPNQFVSPVANTYYPVLCHRTNGCWKRDSVLVKIYDGNLDLHVSNDTIINEEEFAHLYASGANSYVWKQTNTAVSTKYFADVSPATKTTYIVYGKDACFKDSAYVTVEVNPLEFFIPNLITPNGDGQNDSFKITNFGQRWNLEVYNRWGDIVYKKDKYIKEWDGRNLSDGVYFFHIKDTKTSELYKGWVEIVR